MKKLQGSCHTGKCNHIKQHKSELFAQVKTEPTMEQVTLLLERCCW